MTHPDTHLIAHAETSNISFAQIYQRVQSIRYLLEELRLETGSTQARRPGQHQRRHCGTSPHR